MKINPIFKVPIILIVAAYKAALIALIWITCAMEKQLFIVTNTEHFNLALQSLCALQNVC